MPILKYKTEDGKFVGLPIIQGPKGDTGPQGPKGEKGDTGEGISILGSYSTEEELRQNHPTGSLGDAYLVLQDLYIWSDTANDWVNAGTIKGEKGDTGPQGPQGETGPKGDTGEQGPSGTSVVVIEATDEATALSLSQQNPNNIYYWSE